MTQPSTISPASLVAHYQQHLQASQPFSLASSRHGAGDIYLLPPHPNACLDDQHIAMRALVRLGLLSDYRYIDAEPQAVILAIRA